MRKVPGGDGTVNALTLRHQLEDLHRNYVEQVLDIAKQASILVEDEPSDGIDVSGDGFPVIITAARSAGVPLREIARELHAAPSSVLRWELRTQHPSPLMRTKAAERMIGLMSAIAVKESV